MQTTKTEQQSKQTLTTLLDNVRNNLGSSEEQFNEAAKALEDFLRSPRTKAIFYGSKYMDDFMRKDVMAVATAAHKIRKDLYAMVARVSKEYDIKA